jgi:hypothetical protein
MEKILEFLELTVKDMKLKKYKLVFLIEKLSLLFEICFEPTTKRIVKY